MIIKKSLLLQQKQTNQNKIGHDKEKIDITERHCRYYGHVYRK
jgi:hypothetical protein